MDALFEAMGLKVHDMIDIFQPNTSRWERETVYTELQENGDNNVWLMRRTTVGRCNNFARFLRILSSADGMPRWEAQMATVVELE